MAKKSSQLSSRAVIERGGKRFEARLCMSGAIFWLSGKGVAREYCFAPGEFTYARFWIEFLRMRRGVHTTATLHYTNSEASLASRLEVKKSRVHGYYTLEVYDDWSVGSVVFSMELRAAEANSILEEVSVFLGIC